MEHANQQVQHKSQVIPKWQIFIISATTFMFSIIALIMNIFMRQPLFIMGINFIQDYQSSQPHIFVRTVYNLFSILGNTWFIVGLLVIIYLTMYRKLLVVVYLTYMLSNIYILGIMKPSFQQPRPFWYSEKIIQNQWSCQKQYGFPSGHSLISALFYEPIIAQLILCEFLKFPFNKILLIFPILTAAFIPLSRLYLGSHSTDQILYGLLMSFYALVLYRYCLQKWLYRLYQQTLNPEKSIMIPIIILVSLFIILAAPIILYLININTRGIDRQYIVNIQKVCKNNQTYEKIEGQQLESISFIQLIFGFLFGCIIASSPCFKQFQFSQKLILYFTGRWGYVVWYNIFLVLILYILLLGPIIGFFFIGLDYFLHNSIAIYLLKSLGAILIGMILLVIVPLISIRLGIITLQNIKKCQDTNDVKKDKSIKKVQVESPFSNQIKNQNQMKTDLQFVQNI